MAAPDPIDLLHLGRERVIASYVLDTDDGPALLDCGPTTCIDALEAGLAARGLALTDIRHLLLTHIHLDHAGAAGVLVRRNPALQVHVSPVGAPHLIEPERLENSARRLYGDSFDSLWGELAPIPRENVHPLDLSNSGGPVVGLESFPTPGHASHHVCYLDRDGTLYAGDACGVRVLPGRSVMPPTPPPDTDIAAWEESLDEIGRRAPERLALIHFGVAEDVSRHLDELRFRLLDWAESVEGGATEEEFVEYALAELSDSGEDADAFVQAMPLWQSYRGLARWAEKRKG